MKIRPDTRPKCSRLQVGRGSNAGGQGQQCRWVGAVMQVGKGSMRVGGDYILAGQGQ